MDREPQEDSNGVIESFWDGHGVEFKAKYVVCFSARPQKCGLAAPSMARSHKGVFCSSKNTLLLKIKDKDFFEWSAAQPLLISKIGIPEPISKKKVYPDILLVPLLAFNKKKFRLGYGGGYYDRYIQKIKNIKKILTIGMAFSFQEVAKLPINKYDKKLDFIFTENYIK